MATKQFYATGDFKYGTRMLRAGDPVEMDAPNAKLFKALGKIADAEPRAAKPSTEIRAGKPGGSKPGQSPRKRRKK